MKPSGQARSWRLVLFAFGIVKTGLHALRRTDHIAYTGPETKEEKQDQQERTRTEQIVGHVPEKTANGNTDDQIQPHAHRLTKRRRRRMLTVRLMDFRPCRGQTLIEIAAIFLIIAGHMRQRLPSPFSSLQISHSTPWAPPKGGCTIETAPNSVKTL